MANINNNTDKDTNSTPNTESNIDYAKLLAALVSGNSSNDSNNTQEPATESNSEPDYIDNDDDSFWDDSLYVPDDLDEDIDNYDGYDSAESSGGNTGSNGSILPFTDQENISNILRSLKNQPVAHIEETAYSSKIYYGMKVADIIDSFYAGCDYKYHTETDPCGFTFNSLHMVDGSHLATSIYVNYQKQLIQFSIKLLDIERGAERKSLLLNAINKIHNSNSYGSFYVSDAGECYLFYSFNIAKGFAIANFESAWFSLLESASKYTDEFKHLAEDKLDKAATLLAVSTIADTSSSISIKCKNKALASSIKSLINRDLTPAEETLITILADSLA